MIMKVESTSVTFGRGNLKICRRGSVLLVALCRPHSMNAFNDDLYEDLIDIMSSAASDDSVAAMVLAGTGPYFSSGADLKGSHFEPEPGGRRTLQKPAGRFMMALIGFPKVLAAAVHGPAVGIGATLLMHCDLVHFSPRATVWAPFTRLALVPELCSSVTFRESMGLSKANELLLLGRKIDAKTALEWNICSRVVEDGDIHDPFHPQALASRLAEDIDQNLLVLPKGNQTAQYFSELVKGGTRRRQMQEVCRRELIQLDERFDIGHVQVAASQLQIGSGKKTTQATLTERSRL
jgi:enoyl-CoA hydratase/carnithine racemase